jgi:hypothetical protein
VLLEDVERLEERFEEGMLGLDVCRDGWEVDVSNELGCEAGWAEESVRSRGGKILSSLT